jgi:hypothetical protein
MLDLRRIPTTPTRKFRFGTTGTTWLGSFSVGAI